MKNRPHFTPTGMPTPGLLRFLAGGWLLCASCLHATVPADPAALASAIDTALVARDVRALAALVDTEGMSPADLSKIERGVGGMIPQTGRALVTVDRLPDMIDIAKPMIFNGQRQELTRAPAGIIRVASQEGKAQLVATLPYVQTPQGFLIAGRKQTDLGWKGPPDRQLGFTFEEDYPPSPCAITIKLNASGVEVEDSFTMHSGAILGQYIQEFTISGLPANFKGRLLLRIGNEVVFRSEPIIGQTSFTYQRSAP
jgi:hypothetical protein